MSGRILRGRLINKLDHDPMPGKVVGRALWKAYCRCPFCNRILKVRIRRQEKARSYISIKVSLEEKYDFFVAEIPPHKVYCPDEERLTKVVINGKAPDEHPWCSFHNQQVIIGTNKSDTPHYRRSWEFIKWR